MARHRSPDFPATARRERCSLVVSWYGDEEMRSVDADADWKSRQSARFWIQSRQSYPAHDSIVACVGKGAVGLTSLRTLANPTVALLSYAIDAGYRGR